MKYNCENVLCVCVEGRGTLRGLATNNEPAAHECNYHSDSNCDSCANVFYNYYNAYVCALY